jgi:hypothetical protein
MFFPLVHVNERDCSNHTLLLLEASWTVNNDSINQSLPVLSNHSIIGGAQQEADQ